MGKSTVPWQCDFGRLLIRMGCLVVLAGDSHVPFADTRGD
jgi:hypothetical protein